MSKYTNAKYPDKINDLIDNDGNISELGRSKIFGYTEVTYEQLKELRDNKKLIPGAVYRLTDYCGMVPSARFHLSNAGHQFDLLLLALAEDTLSEDAKACAHHFDNPESPEALYFLETNFGAWKIKYCLDPDPNRFDWVVQKSIHIAGYSSPFDYSGVNPINNMYGWSSSWGATVYTQYEKPQGIKPDGSLDFGQVQGSYAQHPITQYTPGSAGVIYELIDEFNNTAPYDFKNILWEGRYLFNLYKSDYSGKHSVDASMNANYRVLNNTVKAQHFNGNLTGTQMNFPYQVMFNGENIYDIVFDNKHTVEWWRSKTYDSRSNGYVYNSIFSDPSKPDQSLNNLKVTNPYDDIFNTTLAPRKYLYMGRDSNKNIWCQLELEWDAIRTTGQDAYARIFSQYFNQYSYDLTSAIAEAIANPNYLSTRFRIIKGLIYDVSGNKYPIYTKDRPNFVMVDGVLYKEYWQATPAGRSYIQFEYVRESMVDQTLDIILNPYFFFSVKSIVPPR